MSKYNKISPTRNSENIQEAISEHQKLLKEVFKFVDYSEYDILIDKFDIRNLEKYSFQELKRFILLLLNQNIALRDYQLDVNKKSKELIVFLDYEQKFLSTMVQAFMNENEYDEKAL